MTNVLMVTTTVGMLHRVHSHTTHLGPAVALHPVLVVGATRLQHGFLSAAAAGHLADGGTAVAADDLLAARGELDAGDAGIRVVGDDDSVVAGAAGEGSTVPGLLLNVADDGTLGHLADGAHVSNVQGGLLAAVDVLASVQALGGNEQLLVLLVADGVAELHLGQRGTTSRVVDDLGHHTPDVAGALGGIEGAKLGSPLPVSVVRFEDGPTALTLTTDNATHLHK